MTWLATDPKEAAHPSHGRLALARMVVDPFHAGRPLRRCGDVAIARVAMFPVIKLSWRCVARTRYPRRYVYPEMRGGPGRRVHRGLAEPGIRTVPETWLAKAAHRPQT